MKERERRCGAAFGSSQNWGPFVQPRECRATQKCEIHLIGASASVSLGKYLPLSETVLRDLFRCKTFLPYTNASSSNCPAWVGCTFSEPNVALDAGEAIGSQFAWSWWKSKMEVETKDTVASPTNCCCEHSCESDTALGETWMSWACVCKHMYMHACACVCICVH